MLVKLAAAAASQLRAPKLRALRAFHVQCPSLTPASAALCANGRHPLLLRGLPAMKAIPGVPRKAPLCSQVAWGKETPRRRRGAWDDIEDATAHSEARWPIALRPVLAWACLWGSKKHAFSSRSFSSRTATEAGYRRAVCSRSEHKENRPQAGLAGEGFSLSISWTFSQPFLALWLRLLRQREKRYERPNRVHASKASDRLNRGRSERQTCRVLAHRES